jgi:hypothetical protein
VTRRPGICNRDASYCTEFCERVEATSIKEVITPPSRRMEETTFALSAAQNGSTSFVEDL